MKPLSIKIYLPEGDPNGIRVAEISMSTIQAIAFRRNQLGKVRKTFPEISRPGVYILLGPDEGNADRGIAYIGESETVSERLSNHNKDFWTDTIVLISKDETLTKSHARYVEAQLMAEAGKNPQWNLNNSQQAIEAGKLPLSDRAAMNVFVEQTVTLVGVLGCDLFRVVQASFPEKSGNISSEPTTPSGPVFFYKGTGFRAEMIVSASGQFIVRRDSQARLQTKDSIQPTAESLRKSLKENDILKQAGDALVFNKDYPFKSLSAAAGVISASSVNGRTNWKLEDGTTYDAWEKRENESAFLSGTGGIFESDSSA